MQRSHPQLWLTYTLLVLSMLFWGMSFVWFRVVVQYMQPLSIIFIRLVFASLLLLAVLWVMRISLRMQEGHFVYFAALAFAQPLCYFLGESFGLTRVSSTTSSFIIATIPLFSAMADVLIRSHRLGRGILGGLILSFAGIFLLLAGPKFHLQADAIGLGLLFFAVISAVAYSLIIRKIAPHYPALVIIAWQCILGAAYFLPLFLIFDWQSFVRVKTDARLLLYMAQLVVFASVLAYVFYISAFKALDITRVNVFTNLIPIFTGIGAFLVLGESFRGLQVVGMVLVLAGVALTQIKDRKEVGAQ